MESKYEMMQKPMRPLQARSKRKPIEIRVEVESLSQWMTTRTRDLSHKGLSIECGSPIAVGDPMNVLLFIPREKDFDLIKVHSEAVWCQERQGLFTVGSAFRKFAPGDERRLKEWLIGHNDSKH